MLVVPLPSERCAMRTAVSGNLAPGWAAAMRLSFAGDFAQEEVRDHVGRKLEVLARFGEVVGQDNCAKHGRDVQHGAGGLGERLIGHRGIARAEVHRLVQELADTAAAADGLVVDLDIGMSLVIFAEPLLVHRIGKSCSSSVQSCLP